jgi:hypothetical protein
MKKRDDRNLFPGALEFMILRTLQRQTLHGFALVEQIRRSSNDLLQIEEGALFSGTWSAKCRAFRKCWKALRASLVPRVCPWKAPTATIFAVNLSKSSNRPLPLLRWRPIDSMI